MDNYLDREIKQLNKEILALKTSAQKSAGIVPTVMQTFGVTIQLRIQSTAPLSCSGMAEYVITTENDALLMVTLDKYYDDITKVSDDPRTTRNADLYLSKYNDGKMSLIVSSYGTYDDAVTIQDGGSVSISRQVTIRCTSDFTIERIN